MSWLAIVALAIVSIIVFLGGAVCLLAAGDPEGRGAGLAPFALGAPIGIIGFAVALGFTVYKLFFG